MEITLPHLFTPRPYQLPFLQAWDSGKKRLVIVWHRRSGKDMTAFSVLPKKMFERKGAYFYLAPTYEQGRKIIWDGMSKDGVSFLDHIPKEIIKGQTDKPMQVELINGSYLEIIGTDKIDSIVGTNPIGCIFTEYSLQDPKAWDLIRPILAENGGWAVFIFTPRGMNHGWKILQQAQNDPSWFWQVLTVDDTQAISQSVLEQERREMPQDLFDQEYYCKFLEGAGAFFKRVDDNIQDTPIVTSHPYQLGVDLAKYQDWTVITPFDLQTFEVKPQIRFNQVDWNLQKARIEAEARRYNNATVFVDSTGVGDPIAEDLSRTGLTIEAFKFTETSRRQLLDHLSLLLSQDRIKLPNDEGLKNELKSMAFSLSDRGKITVNVPDGLTDDRIMSLALAVWNQFTPQKPIIDEIIDEHEPIYSTIGI